MSAKFITKKNALFYNNITCISNQSTTGMILPQNLLQDQAAMNIIHTSYEAKKCHISKDQPYSREKMHNFTIEFLKCAKFHGKFTKGVWKIHGKFTGPTAVILRCYVNAN